MFVSLQGEEECVFTVYEDEIGTPMKGPLHTTMDFCQICGNSFGSLKVYKTHSDEHKGIFKYNCDECQEGFSTKPKYETHMRKAHTGERFACTICGKSFMTKTGLSRHGKVHNKPWYRDCVWDTDFTFMAILYSIYMYLELQHTCRSVDRTSSTWWSLLSVIRITVLVKLRMDVITNHNNINLCSNESVYFVQTCGRLHL